jgi:hypothetical protein
MKGTAMRFFPKLPKAPPKLPPMFSFTFMFADGTYEQVAAPSPGEARSKLKERRGGPLPKVVSKFRKPAASVSITPGR